MRLNKLIVLASIGAVIALAFTLDVGQHLDLDQLRARRDALGSLFDRHPVQTALAYCAGYVVVTAFSLPGAAVMTLAGGAIFGLAWGTLFVSFASSIGALLAFTIARFLLHDWVQQRYAQRLATINRGIERDGAFYLFTLRLVAVFPFFLINLLMALTPIRTWTFYWVSQLGMLAGTLVYVNTGTQITRIESAQDVFSPGLLGAFALLGVFPLVARKTVSYMKDRRALARHPKPKHFERNLVVIGAGSGGLVSAYIAATVGARVTLVERDLMGGDCLNTGCVPSKALIQTSRFLAQSRHAEQLGIKSVQVEVDFAQVMQRVQRVIAAVAPHDSVERYTKLGVEVIQGEARITSPYTVAVGGREITTRAMIIATGARPFVPPIEGLVDAGYQTSETIWSLRTLPPRLIVLGGGPLGCELAQAFARLGSKVIQIESSERLLSREDKEVSRLVHERFVAEGMDVRVGYKAVAARSNDSEKVVVCERDGQRLELQCDEILVALGRKPDTSGFGLEELGVPLTSHGTIETNDFLQTRFPNIYACGDVAGPYQFTHTASHQAWYATVNALFGSPFKRFRVDYSVIPQATFTDPEVARVGLNEQEAIERQVDYEVSRYDMSELDRAIADEAAEGFVKVLTVPGKGRILGATIAGPQAGELISEYVVAMRHGLGMNKILSTIHAYPTLSEANKFAAGEWKRSHAPEWALRWGERFHSWRRGHTAGSTR